MTTGIRISDRIPSTCDGSSFTKGNPNPLRLVRNVVTRNVPAHPLKCRPPIRPPTTTSPAIRPTTLRATCRNVNVVMLNGIEALDEEGKCSSYILLEIPRGRRWPGSVRDTTVARLLARRAPGVGYDQRPGRVAHEERHQPRGRGGAGVLRAVPGERRLVPSLAGREHLHRPVAQGRADRALRHVGEHGAGVAVRR